MLNLCYIVIINITLCGRKGGGNARITALLMPLEILHLARSNELEKFFSKMLQLKKNQIGIKDEKEFEEVFAEMQWTGDMLGSGQKLK